MVASCSNFTNILQIKWIFTKDFTNDTKEIQNTNVYKNIVIVIDIVIDIMVKFVRGLSAPHKFTFGFFDESRRSILNNMIKFSKGTRESFLQLKEKTCRVEEIRMNKDGRIFFIIDNDYIDLNDLLLYNKNKENEMKIQPI